MTQPTLPVLGGGERALCEMQNCERFMVKLEDGCIVHAMKDKRGVCGNVGRTFFRWRFDGTPEHAGMETQPVPPIVRILGPSEETHGDGTVTKLVTWPVTAETTYWEEFEIIHMEPSWRFKPKPTPSPTYTERLIEAVRKGEVVLPPGATHLAWHHNLGAGGKGMWFWYRDEISPRQNWQWSAHSNGPLPPWQPGDETSIDLATVRDALTKQETT